jgi:hypothetical protein
MRNVSGQFHYVCQLASTLLSLIVEAGCYLGLCLRPSPTLAAENLFLRKQLAHIPAHLVVRRLRCILIASRSQDLQAEHPIWRW